jgi:phosphonate transport system substrate-binding protein
VAAGVNSQLVEGYARREGKSYRVLWSTAPLHDLALMSSAKVPDKHVKLIAKAFTEMHKDPKGRDILEQASKQVGLTAEAYFIPSDGSEYNAYREFYRSAPPQLR